MTLLDAPEFDPARERRNRILIISTSVTIFTFLVIWWLLAGRPIDWPWHWNNYIYGNASVNRFLSAVEQGRLKEAYGIWFHDPDWQSHPDEHESYSFARFLTDWSPTSQENVYGAIRSHKLAGERMNGNVLIVGIYLNGQRKNPLFLAYDPRLRELTFSPIPLQLGPLFGLKRGSEN